MTLWQLIVRQLGQRKLSSFLTGLGVALGVMLVSGILLLQDQMEKQLLEPGRGYSLAVGAPGSALQLALNAVYHLDKSPGLMPMRTWLELENDDSVALAVPYAVGDSFRGYRVVATTDAFFDRRFPHPEGEGQEKLAEGRPFDFSRERLFEVLDEMGAAPLTEAGATDAGDVGSASEDRADEHVNETHAGDDAHDGAGHDHGHDEHGEGDHAEHDEHGEGDHAEHGHDHGDDDHDEHGADDHDEAGEHGDDDHDEAGEHGHEHGDDDHVEHGEHDEHGEHAAHADDDHDDHDGHGDGEHAGHDHDHDHDHDHGAVMEAVLGAEVARALRVRVGDTIEPTHGVEDDSMAHDHEHLWKVVGILKRTGTPVDRVVFINLDSFFAIDEHAAGGLIPGTQEAALSSVLLFPRGGVHKAMLLSRLNRRPDVQVADVNEQIRNLLSIVGSVDVLFFIVSILVVVIGVLSILVAIYNTMNERRREVAILRAIGARRRTVFGAIVGEAATLTVFGSVAGLVLGHLLVWAASGHIGEVAGFRPLASTILPAELLVVAIVTAGGALAGVVPAWKAYSTDVAESLRPLS